MKSEAVGQHRGAVHGLSNGRPATRSRREIVASMKRIAPPGIADLEGRTLEQLRSLTADLVRAVPGAPGEYGRFVETAERGIDLDTRRLREFLAGKSILVTGGTGCVGTRLLLELEKCKAVRLSSVSRGVTAPAHRVPSVDYIEADITDPEGLGRAFVRAEPDIVFHLAAQRDPGLAEREVVRTVTTNVAGTLNVVELCSELSVGSLVYASTGKALRPYTREVYAGTKRVAEWMVASLGVETLRRSLVRFTHVVDNSLIAAKLDRWRRGGVVRLHESDIRFFIQSAKESAQLLLVAAMDAAEVGRVPLLAIRNLGTPVDLTALALGAIAGSDPVSPIYFSGFESGYETAPYPGLYFPETSVDVSVLLNSLEGYSARAIESSPAVDVAVVPTHGDDLSARAELGAFETSCQAGMADGIRMALDRLLRTLMASNLAAYPQDLLARTAAFTMPLRTTMSDAHLAIDDALRSVCAPCAGPRTSARQSSASVQA